MIPIFSRSTLGNVPRKSTAAMKSSVLISTDAVLRGSPPLSPVKDGSKATVIKPFSAIVWAYKPEDCSFTAPNGPDTANAATFLSPRFLGIYTSAAIVIP